MNTLQTETAVSKWWEF